MRIDITNSFLSSGGIRTQTRQAGAGRKRNCVGDWRKEQEDGDPSQGGPTARNLLGRE